MTDIAASVGTGGENRADDVRMVQRLLNDHRGRAGLPLLEVDGIAGPLTISALRDYQIAREVMDVTSGSVQPGDRTMRSLQSDLLTGIGQGVVRFDLPRPPTDGPDPTMLNALAQRLWDAMKK
jgi:hypothetical protein